LISRASFAVSATAAEQAIGLTRIHVAAKYREADNLDQKERQVAGKGMCFLSVGSDK
jgi:hypothetical protein